jgi:hypothetical protein
MWTRSTLLTLPLLALALFMRMPLSRADSSPEKITTLAAMRDCSRPLLLFAPSATDPLLKQQVDELLAHRRDLSERDIVVSIILPDGTPRPADLPFLALSPEDEATARRRFHQDASHFSVVLAGKDGGEKMHSDRVMAVADLNRKVDSMPMRREEMAGRK